MTTKVRLTGLDLFRCLGIFGVILVHSDEGIFTDPSGWTQILEFSSFAVPFFLATSFYLTFDKIYKTGGEYSLKERLARLLVPYCVWTALYIAYKALKYLLQNDLDNLIRLLQDPVAIIFFGGAAFQLYFVSLLVAGTLLVKPISISIEKEAKINGLIALSILTLILYEVILSSGNSFQIDGGTAFQALLNEREYLNFKDNPIVRIILTEIALMIRCLPYMFIAIILSKIDVSSWVQKDSKIWVTVLWIVAFLVVNIWGGYFLPKSIYELAQGFSALLAGIMFSKHLRSHKIISSLSACSFGIYLIHLLVVETFQTIEARIYPGGMFRVSTANLLIFSLITLAFSWIATDILMRNRSIAKILFGV